MSGFPFRRLLGLAVTRLGLSPAAFWAMTPRELSAALAACSGAAPAPLERGNLLDLMRRYPDDSGEDK